MTYYFWLGREAQEMEDLLDRFNVYLERMKKDYPR